MADELFNAAARFDTFFAFAEAIVEMDGESALDDERAVIVSVMGAGASDALRVSDFRRLRAALNAVERATETTEVADA